MTVVNGTKAGYEKSTPVARQQKDVTILDIYRNVSSVKIVASDWIGYLQVAKVSGNWRIIDVLWEPKSTPAP